MMRSSRRVRTLWSRWQLSRGSHLDNVKGGRAHEVACLSELWRELCGGVSLLREEPWRKDQFNDAVCRSTGPEERSSGYGEVRAVCEHDDRRDGVDGQRCATGSFSADAQRVSFARRRQQRRGRTHLCAADRGWRGVYADGGDVLRVSVQHAAGSVRHVVDDYSSAADACLMLGVELLRDAFDGVMGREDGTLLPADEVREVVAGEVGLPLRLFQLGVGRLATGEKIVG